VLTELTRITPGGLASPARLYRLLSVGKFIRSIDMSEMQASRAIATIKRLNETSRDYIAFGIWLAVFAGLQFTNAGGQSELVTAGLMFQLTAAYSTFLLCGKTKFGPLVHGVPYILTFAGAVLLVLAPSFRDPVGASLMFLTVTAMMHASVVCDMQKESTEICVEA
jgi:hypothetical protein